MADRGDVVQATASHTIRRTGGAGSGGVRHALGLSPTSRLSRCATSGKLTSDESPRAARCTLACGSPSASARRPRPLPRVGNLISDLSLLEM